MQILELALFYLTYIILFISTIGFGFYFNNFLKLDCEKNLGIILILGLIFLTIVSYVSIFFLPHNFLFNSIIFCIGLIFFLFNYKNTNKLNFAIFLASIVFIGMVISKTHDDFAFYHFQQSISFTRSKIMFGMSNLDFSYAKHSSLLYLNSLFYLPYFKYYFFNAPNQIFLTAIILSFYIYAYNDENHSFLRIFSFASITYILLKFTRASEYGTDVIGQLLILLFIYNIFQFFKAKNKIIRENILVLSGIICIFCFTLKTYFVFYTLIYLFLLINIDRNLFINFIKKRITFIFSIFLICISYSLLNIISSGCLIYPIPFLCFENFIWSMPNQEVAEYKIWYETWAKSIAGTGYIVEDSTNVIQKLYWVPFWFKNYFFGRFTDNLGLIFFISIFFLTIFRSKNNIKKKTDINIKIIYLLITAILIFWFLKHPSLRYGGYAPLFLFFLIPLSNYLSGFILDEKIFIKKFNIIFCICLVFFFSKNLLRIKSEIERKDIYQFNNFPYFAVPEVKYKKFILNDIVTVFKPIDNNCWNVPSPCPYKENLGVKKKLNYIIFYKKN